MSETMDKLAGTLGALLSRYRVAVNIVGGLVVIVLGLSYLDVLHLPFFKGMQTQKRVNGVFSAFLFGVIYSVSLTPCIGAFLGSALMLASASGTAAQGTLLLVCYSLGLGIPFLASAVLLERLRSAFGFIKSHYRIINTVCGVLLIVLGILMALGLLNSAMTFFS